MGKRTRELRSFKIRGTGVLERPSQSIPGVLGCLT
jgi:hypothetical protein